MSLLHLFRIQCKNIAWLSIEGTARGIGAVPSPVRGATSKDPLGPRCAVKAARNCHKVTIIHAGCKSGSDGVWPVCLYIVAATITRCLLWFCFIFVIVNLSCQFHSLSVCVGEVHGGVHIISMLSASPHCRVSQVSETSTATLLSTLRYSPLKRKQKSTPWCYGLSTVNKN